MDNATLLIQRMTDAQHNASVSVLLPLLMAGRKGYDAEQEWKMFQPLSVLYAQSFNPKTAIDYPLEFLNWVLGHPNLPGVNDYIKHIVDAANAINAANQAGLDRQQSITAAINVLATYKISIV